MFGVLDRYIGKTVFNTIIADAVHAGVAVRHHRSSISCARSARASTPR